MGITTIYISVNYLSEIIKEHFGDGRNFGVVINYLDEDKKQDLFEAEESDYGSWGATQVQTMIAKQIATGDLVLVPLTDSSKVLLKSSTAKVTMTSGNMRRRPNPRGWMRRSGAKTPLSRRTGR